MSNSPTLISSDEPPLPHKGTRLKARVPEGSLKRGPLVHPREPGPGNMLHGVNSTLKRHVSRPEFSLLCKVLTTCSRVSAAPPPTQADEAPGAEPGDVVVVVRQQDMNSGAFLLRGRVHRALYLQQSPSPRVDTLALHTCALAAFRNSITSCVQTHTKPCAPQSDAAEEHSQFLRKEAKLLHGC